MPYAIANLSHGVMIMAMETPDAPYRQLVIFDLNKTLINGASWYDFNIAMGVTPEEDEMLYRLGPEKQRILSYHEWLDILKKIIIARGRANRAAIEAVLLNYQFQDGAIEVVAELQCRGHLVAIISGGFNLVVDDVARKLGIEHAYNNTYLVFDQDDMLEDIPVTWDEDRYKTMLVQSVCRRFGVHPKEVFYVADGDNDNEIFTETIGVALDGLGNVHEPWKQDALDKGEKFSRHSAIEKAHHKIPSLRDLLDIVGRLSG